MDSKNDLRKAAQAVVDEADNPLGLLPVSETNNLLKRINAALYDDADPYQALRDCRAEIERLSERLEEMNQRHLDWIDRSDP